MFLQIMAEPLKDLSMKRVKILPVLLLVTVLVFGDVVNAAACPPCELAGVNTELQTHGTHLWDHTYHHIKYYSVGGVLYHEECDYWISEDQVDWVCPAGHGLISSMIHHIEAHSSSHCVGDNKNYYY